MELQMIDEQGQATTSVAASDAAFGRRYNESLVHQVVTAYLANARSGNRAQKGRSDVAKSTRKPWRQKGTGRARHGSIRSPIWKGGGVTHGPRNDKSYAREIPKKMRAKALFMALSKKLKDGELILVDSFGLEAPKTATAKKVLVALSGVSGFEKLVNKRKNSAVIAFAQPSEALKKSFRNIGNVSGVAVRDLNPLSVLSAKYLIIENPETAFKIVETRGTKAKKN